MRFRFTESRWACVQMVKNQAYSVCYLFPLWQWSVRVESVRAPWGVVDLGRCLVLWWSIFLPVVDVASYSFVFFYLQIFQYRKGHDVMYYYLILHCFLGATFSNNKKENKVPETSKYKRAAVQSSERRTRSAFFLDTPVRNVRMKSTRILFHVTS